MTRQSQTGGDYSTNVQGAGPVTIVHAGLSIEDAKEIALGLARPEFERLTGQATATACARAEEMVVERLLPRLMELNPAGIETFADPDVQYALMAAQRTYARTGDQDVADVLVDILVDRTRETERNVLQLSLNESLEVAAKLTADQFAALSLIWLIRYTRSNVSSRDTLGTYIDTYLAPHVPRIRTSEATYQHLEYAGCGSIGIGEISVEGAYRDTYGVVFSKGFTDQELSARFEGSPPTSLNQILMPCPNGPDRQQFSVGDGDMLKERAAQLELTDTETANVVGLFNQQLMNDKEVRDYLQALRPNVMGPLIDAWSNSSMKQMTLTSVGITIAHANCRRIMGVSPADLSIWIN